MSIKRKIALLIAAVLLMSSMSISAMAHEVPDMTRTGSIKISMKYEGKAVAGGTMTIYRVGKILESNGDYRWVKTDAFQNSSFSLENIESPTLAAKIEYFVSKNKDKLDGVTKTIDKNGEVLFDNLELGLYLIIQDKAADGYSTVDAFLVSVPAYENDQYIYDIDAAPKMGDIEKETEPETTTPETNPTGGKLPQTGQLNWPIPVLVIAGLLLFSAGWLLRIEKKKSA